MKRNVPPLSRKDECVGEQLQCVRQWCLFVCLPSGARLTLGALQAREQTELCEH